MPVTALNGRLPSAMLTVADTGANGPQRLRLDAAASEDRMVAAGMPAGCLRSGYRTLAQQRAQDPNLALAAGKSFHGEGIAADFDEPARSWITRHGLPYGWRIGFVPGEPWHAQYDRPDKRITAPAPVPAPQTLKELPMFDMIFDINGTGYVFTANGSTNIANQQEYGLLVRLKNLNQSGGEIHLGDKFAVAEIPLVAAIFRRIAPAATATATIDYAKLAAELAKIRPADNSDAVADKTSAKVIAWFKRA